MIRFVIPVALVLAATTAALGQSSRGGSIAPPTPGTVLFAPEQEQIIRRSLRTNAPATSPEAPVLKEGSVVAEDIELSRFPRDVYTFVPMVRSYRYLPTRNGIAMVDPASRMVVRVIDSRSE